MPFERPEIIEHIRAEASGRTYRPAKRRRGYAPPPVDYDEAPYLFTVCTGNRWMDLGSRQPEAKMLFGEFWHERELCILFADTNIGKSVLAVQIAENIARGQATGPLANGAKATRVMYVDFELNTSQFYQRYHSAQGDHEFADKFYRAEFDYSRDTPADKADYDNYLFYGLENKLRLIKANVLIIDNLACLCSGTENASVALKVMRRLKALKADLGLSVLVLAHTPKRRDPARPIGADDLHGSKMLINLADSAFTMGQSATKKGLCYLKQIKQRNTQPVYHADNVCLCRLTRPGSFLHFTFEGTGTERVHLLKRRRHGYNRARINRAALAKTINTLSAGGLSQLQISKQLRIAVGTVNKLLRMEAKDGQDNREARVNSPPGDG